MLERGVKGARRLAALIAAGRRPRAKTRRQLATTRPRERAAKQPERRARA